MAYRDLDSDAFDAPTAEGRLGVVLGPNRVDLLVAHRSLHVSNRFALLVDRAKKRSLEIEGKLVIARDVPHEDLGMWLEVGGGMRRIFGVEPVSLLDPHGLAALRRLDSVAHRIRATLANLAGDVRRAVELGRGLDKVLVADHGDRYAVYARRLFRDRAQLAMTIHDDGRITLPGGKEVRVSSRFGVGVRGDYIRFADDGGTDLARVSIPWIGPEDRRELAGRIGHLVDR